MKSYYGEREVRFTGKAWEIRHRLRTLAAAENTRGATLSDALQKRTKAASRTKTPASAKT
ncbi:Z-ring formation inhibitor MciZ [Paenibacillus thermotolerans]|uniref:Z-ring formation inhibitor MciZ n=1 Tax=Paenibacillus thermotolerans TaxID=3027807 RepID=UPI00236861F0|nr:MULTISPECIES: Z-ring formation inhibitor MciZ [unclassified Paenibacillus]